MIERGDRPRFVIEALFHRGIARPLGRQDLDRDDAVEAGVASFVDFAHPAGADGAEDLVGPKASASAQRHYLPAFGSADGQWSRTVRPFATGPGPPARAPD